MNSSRCGSASPSERGLQRWQVALARVFLMGVLLLIVTAPVRGDVTRFDLSGTVTDATGAVLPGATVTIRNADTGSSRSTVTDAEGRYAFNALPPTGRWTITVELQGMQTHVRQGLEFKANTKPEINFQLTVGGLQEALTVAGVAPLVRARESEVSTILDAKQVTELPTNGRNFISLLQTSGTIVQTTTGASSLNLSANGQGTRLLNFLADGVSMTGREIRNVNGEFGNGTGFSLEVIKEVQVITAGFKAETGQTGAGTVSVVTKSGTNTLAGIVYGYWRPTDFVARNLLTGLKTTQRRSQFGGTLGGPIRRDRTHFFGSFEGNQIDDEVVVTSRLAPGTFSTPDRQYQGFGKINQRFSDRHLFDVRYNFNRNKTEAGVGALNTDERRSKNESQNDTTVASIVSTFGSNLVNEARFRYTYDVTDTYSPFTASSGKASRTPDFSRAPVTISRAGVGNAGTPPTLPQNLVEKRAQWVDHVSISAGAHQWKFGGDLIASWRFVTFFNNFAGTYTFPLGTPFPYNQANPATYPTQFTQSFGNSGLNFKDAMIAAFAQDDWQVRKGITLNLGVRWDKDTLFPGDNNNLAPRAGFAWNIGGRGDTVIHGNTGIFYDTLESSLINRESNFGPRGQETIDLRSGDPLFPTFPNRFSQFPTGTRLVPRATVFVPVFQGDKFPFSIADTYQRVAPYYFNSNVGIQRQISSDWAVSVDYTRVRGYDLLATLDINAPPRFEIGPGRMRSQAQADALRPLGVPNQTGGPFGIDFTGFRVLELQANGGETQYDGVKFGVTKRFADGYTMQANYTYGRSRGDVEQFRDNLSFVPGLTEPDGDRSYQQARLSTDTPHVFVTSGLVQLPWGVQLSGILFARSGFPYTGVVGTDQDGDGITGTSSFHDRPASLKRNSLRLPAFVSLDLSAAKRVQIHGTHAIQVRFDIFNVMNRRNVTNVNNIIGPDASNPPATFRTTTGVGPQRQAQIAVRYSF